MGQNTRRDPRAKVLSMTVRYRSATLGEFIEHHSYDVSRGGMFIKTPSPFPAGTLLKFEVKIADEQRVLQGVGRVVWKRDEPGGPDEPVGMGIKFIKIDEASRAVIERLVESRGPDSESSYDHAPGSERKMFPDTSGAPEPPPEDRTVMKPASELLDDALRKSGEPEDKPSQADSRQIPPRDAASSAHGSSARASQPPPSEPDSEPPEPRHSYRPVQESEDEGSGRKATFLLLAAAGVAFGIFLLTKEGEQPAPAPVPVASPEPAPSPAPSLPEPALAPELPPEPEPEPEPQPESESEPEAPQPAPAPQAVPVPKPATRPSPAPAPRPKPLPAPTAAPAVAPGPAPGSSPEPEPKPEPAPPPMDAPTPSPAPAPSPPPSPAPESGAEPPSSEPG